MRCHTEESVSRYDDPRWYEEQDTNPALPPAYDDFNTYPAHLQSHPDAQQQNPFMQPLSPEPEHRIQRILGQVFVVSAFVVIAFCAGWFAHQSFGDSLTNDQSQAYSQLIQQAWTTIDQRYVDRKAVDYKKMAYAAIDAMAQSLNDKGHTRFLTPDQVQSQNQQLSGKFIGIGIYLRQDANTKQLIIASPIPGSPAEKAGLKRGDVIISINGTSTAGKDITAVDQSIQGSAGTSVILTVQRAGVQKPISIHVTRAEIQVPNVLMHYIPESHIAHIQIVQFADGTSTALKDALTKAKSMGATKIILDLRNNPGGYVQEAINTASFFIKSGNVLLEQDSTGARTPVPVTGSTANTTDTLVVLINENSASAAEIVSGALQDNKRATLIGETTFGTGTVLEQISLSDGSALLLGIQEWLTPRGHFIRDKGITPDIKVALSPNNDLTPDDENQGNLTEQQILKSGDAQLAAAIKYLQDH